MASPPTSDGRARTRQRKETSNVAIVDGSNVAYATEGQPPHVANILVVRDKLVEEGLEPIVVADAALRHQIDDAAQYEKLIDTASSGKRRPVPMQITSFCRSPGS